MSDELSDLQSLLQHVGSKPVPLARLAYLLLKMGHDEQARDLCGRAIALAPDDEEVHAISSELFSRMVPSYYFSMVRDRVRHAAIEKALRRAMRPGLRVLEIGTGTGLLAMLAARAGAAEVFTCESNPVVAASASEIIVRNGFSGRVHVIAKSSSDLQVGVDLPEPADLLIWDTLGSNMIGAGALPVLEHAMRHLMRPGGQAIPARGQVRIALATADINLRQMHIVEGFDLSPFNQLAAACYPMNVGDERLTLRSAPADLFRFDFQSGGPFPEARASATLVAPSGGSVNGIAQWQRLEFDQETSYENRPSRGASSVFNVVFYALSRPLDLKPGSQLVVSATHDRCSFRIWIEV